MARNKKRRIRLIRLFEASTFDSEAPRFSLGSVYGILQGFTGLEVGDFCRGDLDRIAGARVAAGTGGTLLDSKGAETYQGNLIPLFRAPVMLSTIASRARPAAALGMSADAAIASISSDLFTLNPSVLFIGMVLMPPCGAPL